VSGDSSGADDTAYPFPKDDNSWDMMRHKEDGEYTYVIRKDFPNVRQLNKEFAYREDTVKVNAVVKLDKKFRWFYTFYRYEETFFRFFPFNGADLSDFVTPEEMQRYSAGTDSTDIEAQFEAYATHAMFNEFYAKFVGAVKKSSINMSTALLESQKTELYDKTMQWDFFENETLNFAHHFLQVCDEVYAPSQSFMRLEPQLDKLNQKYIDYYEFISEIIGEDYQIEVSVPGHVLDTNANSAVKDDLVVWEIQAEDFHYRDYTMWVESRRLNVLPTALAGLFILIGVVLLWLSARRARKEKLAAQGIAWQDRNRFVMRWWLSTLLLMLSLGITAWAVWMLILFHSEPLFFLDIFDPSPAENALFISLIVLGALLIIFACYQLILYIKTKNASQK
jgi:hypothetical protein